MKCILTALLFITTNCKAQKLDTVKCYLLAIFSITSKVASYVHQVAHNAKGF